MEIENPEAGRDHKSFLGRALGDPNGLSSCLCGNVVGTASWFRGSKLRGLPCEAYSKRGQAALSRSSLYLSFTSNSVRTLLASTCQTRQL